jgi:hypothetical protein
MVVDRAVSHYQLIEATANTEQLESSTERVGSQIRRFTDEFCGTWPPRFPWPWPPKFDPKELHPMDFLVAGAEFQKIADTIADNKLQHHLSAAANRLFEIGLKRLGDQSAAACSQ